MAGYIATQNGWREFHIDERDLTYELTQASRHQKVMMLQLDGDELAAALWGLDNYVKPTR